MKRSEIKRRPLSDTVLASLEPDIKEYREQDGNGLYFRVKPDGQKSWQLRYKTPAGKWSWLGLGGYPEVSGAFARQKAVGLNDTASTWNTFFPWNTRCSTSNKKVFQPESHVLRGFQL
ncbi:uncharacterized protein DUF4102 [Pseudomonas poae]|uniref:Uncharacterized protein DUF4102 n=1 Tax=Pseudomonas poae TaxID=200451 RepID=A0A7Z1GM26_9PSED|nr:uncharacterized protein DUF4102 [Pseudomonas poae]